MRIFRLVMPAVLCAGLAGFAIVSLASDGSLFAPVGEPTALQRSDDPIHNGLHIMHTRSNSPRLERTWNDESAVILLDNWVFTSKGKPSPYN
jgi:hypothetical protein